LYIFSWGQWLSFRVVLSRKSCIWSVVIISTWSDNVCSVSVSYCTRFLGSVASMRSMQDFLSPFSYVCLAGEPGRSPLRMYHPLFSHVSISHFALMLTVVSSLCLGISVSPILGWRFPIRAFQSPQITDLSCGGMCPRMSSTSFLAESSSMPRVYRFVAGGRYTLPIHIVSPPCPYIPNP
jgi:hypothetical protein